MRYLAILTILALITISACSFTPVLPQAEFEAYATARAMPAPPVTIVPAIVPPTATEETLVPTVTPTCLIKGNVSSTGELIFHVPGGAAYDQTQIDPTRHNAAGVHEQYFCDEASAQAAGFRKSSR